MAQPAVVIAERRNYNLKDDELWQRLNLSQKFTASSLNKFGYELAFIRHDKNSGQKIVVMLCGDKAATISELGEIDDNPQIELRKASV